MHNQGPSNLPPQPGTQVPPNVFNQLQNKNHGGHELFDVHEILSGIINMLDQYQLYDQHIKDPELKEILIRQSAFVTAMYNTIVEIFQTGHEPNIPMKTYTMSQSHTTTYGIKPNAPKKPNQSVNDLTDKGLSSYMLGHTKALASLFAMTALEMTNPGIRRAVTYNVPNFIEMSYEIFLYQNKNGFYQVPQLNEQDMSLMLKSYMTTPQRNIPQ
ncbi:spore coat protein [Bacillus spongiae]|uniref:Spore coat protein n=1 Tax=Bacillus spongiae TaxID=2683610 RepID=A0ABU8HCQ1_9BACI